MFTQKHYRLALSLIFFMVFLPLSDQSASPLFNSENTLIQEELLAGSLKQAFAETSGRDNTPYHIQQYGDDATATNPAHDLNMTFSKSGVELNSATETWHWSLLGYGYGEQLIVAPVQSLTTAANRLEYVRGNLTEWYINSPLGLEQGFTLQAPPIVHIEGEALVLVLQMDGDITLAGNSLHLGQNLSYGGLMVYDATGKTLPAQLDLQANQLAIQVDDTDAVYPLTIDPWIEQQMLTASDGLAGDQLGFDVAIDGDTAIVGAWLDDSRKGSAYVFVRNGGVWSQQQKLTGINGSNGDHFGYSVDVSGNTVIVGHRWKDVAYVFVRSGTTWSLQQQLTASDNLAGSDEYSISVAIDGNTALVGASANPSPAGSYVGAAYVYVRNGTTWTQQQKLIASDRQPGDLLGLSVALQGDTALIGALGDDTPLGAEVGAAYFFTRSSGIWTQQQKITASDGVPGAWYGVVALDGNTALVGAIGGPNLRGKAYVYVQSGGIWTFQQQLAPGNGSRLYDLFAFSVAIEGNIAVVGSLGGNYSPGYFSGAAYVYVRSGTTWTQAQMLLPNNPSQQDEFGRSVALDNLTLIVGAQAQNVAGIVDKGAAYVFNNVTLPPAPSPISPAHRLHTTINPPTFTWSEINGADMYSLWVYSKNRSYLFKVNTVGQTATSYTLTTPLSPNQYLWRVRDRNGISQIWSRWSPRYTLFVDSVGLSPLRPLH